MEWEFRVIELEVFERCEEGLCGEIYWERGGLEIGSIDLEAKGVWD